MDNKNGEFLMKSFYWLENWERKTQQRWWKKFWTSKIHERQKFMIWKMAHKGLSFKQNLIRRGIQLSDVGMAMTAWKTKFTLSSLALLQKAFGLLPLGEFDGMSSLIMIVMNILNRFGAQSSLDQRWEKNMRISSF